MASNPLHMPPTTVTPKGCNSEGRGLPGKGPWRERPSPDWLALGTTQASALVSACHLGRVAQK